MRDLRARSPYALFVKDNYSEISSKHRGKESVWLKALESVDWLMIVDLKLAGVSKKVAEAWKTLSDEKKQVRCQVIGDIRL